MTIRTDISFEWETSPRIITVLAPSTELNLQDLVDTCRYHEMQMENMDDDQLIAAAGKEPLGGGVQVGITATLLNALLAFEARSGPSYIQCNIKGGNLVAVDEDGIPVSSPISPTAFTQIVMAASSSATLITTSVSGIGTPEEVRDAVWSDVNFASHGAGTAGDKLNAAASAGDPWSTDLTAGGYIGNQAGNVLKNVKTTGDATKLVVDDLAIDQASILSLVETLLKYSKNRTRVDNVAKTLTIYDDDTLTPIKVFNLKDFTGAPSITEIAERMPQP